MCRFMSMFEIIGEYIDEQMAEPLLSPNPVPEDLYSDGCYRHDFKFHIMRCADWKRTSSKQEGFIDPFTMAMDDLFLRVALPNLILLGKWDVKRREKIDNCIADVYISQILR